jgi:hypothetical protein
LPARIGWERSAHNARTASVEHKGERHRCDYTDPALREEAHELFEALEAEEPGPIRSAEASMQLETQFLKQAHFIAWAEYEMAKRLEVERRQQQNAAPRRFRLFRGRAAG